MRKTIDYYMSLKYKREFIEDPDEGGYVVSFPELPGCITVAETLEEAWAISEDAKREWISAALEDGINIVEPRKVDDYSGEYKLRMPKSLHKALVENARMEGISMNQYCLYLLSMNCGQKLQKY